MAETIEMGCDGVTEKWHWYNVANDLQEQGGLKDVVIQPLSVTAHGCGGDLNGNKFYITWVKDKFMLLSMETFSQELVDAFAAVLEYPPFCRYDEDDGLVTVEWDKEDSDGRFTTLQVEGRTNLSLIVRA